jgi:hypothetical protein
MHYRKLLIIFSLLFLLAPFQSHAIFRCLVAILTGKPPTVSASGITTHNSWKSVPSVLIEIEAGLTAEGSAERSAAMEKLAKLVIDPKTTKKSNYHEGSDKLEAIVTTLLKRYRADPQGEEGQQCLATMIALFENNPNLLILGWGNTFTQIIYDYTLPDELRRPVLAVTNFSRARSGVTPIEFHTSASMREKDLIPFLGVGRKDIGVKNAGHADAVSNLFAHRTPADQKLIYDGLVKEGTLSPALRADAIQNAKLTKSTDVWVLCNERMGYKQITVTMPLVFEYTNGSKVTVTSRDKPLVGEELIHRIREALKAGHDLNL